MTGSPLIALTVALLPVLALRGEAGFQGAWDPAPSDPATHLGRQLASGYPLKVQERPKLFTELPGRHTLADAAHDPNHIRRVVTNARRLTLAEGADWLVVMPAAWLHDCVAVPESSPDRRNASRLPERDKRDKRGPLP